MCGWVVGPTRTLSVLPLISPPARDSAGTLPDVQAPVACLQGGSSGEQLGGEDPHVGSVTPPP